MEKTNKVLRVILAVVLACIVVVVGVFIATNGIFKDEEQIEAEKIRAAALTAAHNAVTQYLVSPNTAEFPKGFEEYIFSAEREDIMRVQGYVDSQNAAGANVRSTFVVDIQHTEDWGTRNILFVMIDDEELYRKDPL